MGLEMPVIIGRSGWGALPPNHTVPYANQVDTFVVHHAAGPQPSSVDESIALTQQYQRQHLNTWKCSVGRNDFVSYDAVPRCPDHPEASVVRTFSDIAYNVVAGWNCALIGRGQNVLDGATDTDPSTLTWSCCVLGNYENDTLTPELRTGLLTALQLGVDVYGGRPLAPHRQFYATSCPGGNLVGELASVEHELYGGDTVTPADIDALATAIITKLFAHPMTVTDGEPPVPYQTNFEGVQVFDHRELQLIRRAVTK